jgi:hypothetical protein
MLTIRALHIWQRRTFCAAASEGRQNCQRSARFTDQERGGDASEMMVLALRADTNC